MRHYGINSVVTRLAGKALYLLCWDTVAGEKNTIYVSVTRLSTHRTIPNSQKGNDQKKIVNENGLSHHSRNSLQK